jgi:hypothetical protein
MRRQSGGSLRIEGTPTVVDSGTFTGVTAINRAAQQMQQVADTTQDFGPHVQRIIRIPSGARAGACSVVAKDISSTGARTGRWQIPNRSSILGATSTAPQSGDPYEIITVPSLKMGGFSVEQAAADTVTYCNLHNLNISSAAPTTGAIRSYGGMPVIITSCIASTLKVDADYVMFLACRLGDRGVVSAGHSDLTTSLICMWWSCVSYQGDFIATGATVQVDKDTLFQECPHATNPQSGSYMQFGTVCFFDCTPSGTMEVNETKVTVGALFDGVSAIWGTNNAGRVRVRGGGLLACSVLPTVNAGLGLGREVQLGDIDMLWSDMPARDNLTGSQVVV